jgi:HlyD family secretion protein
MLHANFIDLSDCSEFRQTLMARPPRIVHGTTLLLIALLAAALAWSALVQANLVVRAQGRVRPVGIPTRIFTPATIDREGRVAAAPFDEGDLVHAGDLLVRLDTARIDNSIAKLERTIQASDDELVRLSALESSLKEQLDAARQKLRAELVQSQTNLARAVDHRASNIRHAQASVRATEDLYRRSLKLRDAQAVSEQDLMKAELELAQAQEKLVQAELPVDENQVIIAQRALELLDRDFSVRHSELEARKVVRQGEVEAARKELANLKLQRADAELRSPIDGVVVAGRVQPGDVLAPGKPVLEIARQNNNYFEALVASDDVGDLRVGMPVQIKLDAYDYQKYGVLAGTVTYLSPDSRVTDKRDAGAEMESQAKAHSAPAAFVVRVELHADEVGRGELRGRVKLGLSGTAEIVVGRESVLAVLVKRIRKTISLG